MKIKGVGIHMGTAGVSVCALKQDGSVKGISFPCAHPAQETWEVEVVNELKHVLAHNGWGVRGVPTVLSIDRELTLIKRTELPPAPPDKLKKLVELNASQILPVSSDEMTISFIVDNVAQTTSPLGTHGVDIVAVRSDLVAKVVKATQQSGCEVTAVQPSSVSCLNALWEDARDSFKIGNIVLFVQPLSSGEVILLDGNGLASSISTDVAGAPDAIRLMRAASEQLVPDMITGEVVSILMSSRESASSQGLTEGVVDIVVSPKHPAISAYGAALTASGQARFSAGLGGEDTLTQSRRQKPYSWLAVCILIIAVMVGGWAWLRSTNDALSSRIADARKKLRSMGDQARELEVLNRERNALASVGRKVDLARSDRLPLLVVMGEISKDAPEGLYVTELSYKSGDGLSVAGGSPDEQSLGDFLSLIANSGLFAAVNLEESNRSDAQSGGKAAVAYEASLTMNRVKVL